jgi:hypothetical protein
MSLANAYLPPSLMVVHGDRLKGLRSLVVEWMKHQPLGPSKEQDGPVAEQRFPSESTTLGPYAVKGG